MVLNHKARRYELRISRLVVITIFWVMFFFSGILSMVLIDYSSNVHKRREMQFINYNIVPLARAVQDAPEELKEFANFNIHCMLLHVKESQQTLELYNLAVLFFNLNTLIMLFVVYNRSRKFVMVMGFLLVISMYFTFSFSHRAAEQLQRKVLGGIYIESDLIDK